MDEFEVMKMFREAQEAYKSLQPGERARVKAWVEAWGKEADTSPPEPATTRQKIAEAFKVAEPPKKANGAGKAFGEDTLQRVRQALPKGRFSTLGAIAKRAKYTPEYTRQIVKALMVLGEAEADESQAAHRFRRSLG